jgi:hypothetical protein
MLNKEINLNRSAKQLTSTRNDTIINLPSCLSVLLQDMVIGKVTLTGKKAEILGKNLAPVPICSL